MPPTAPAAPPHPAIRPAIYPAISVVVPTCGRIELLDRCLEALVGQSVPRDSFEIIVVDDAPAPRTRQLVAMWRASTGGKGPAVHYLANPGPHGPAAARNRGWRSARAALIAFTDDDAVPSPNWLRHALEAFDDRIDALCGKIAVQMPATPTAYQREMGRRATAEFVAANCFCRKSILKALGGFDERFRMAWHDDSDLHFRLLSMRARVARAPQALVVLPPAPARWGASLRRLRKTAYDALLYQKHPRLYRQKIGATLCWNHCAAVGALLLALSGLLGANTVLAGTAGALWCALTAGLTRRGLRGTVRTPAHIAEVALTTAMLPPLAVFWRVAGAIGYRFGLT